MPEAPKLVKLTDDEAKSQLGQGFHTGLRKGADGGGSAEAWQALSLMDPDAWNGALSFLLWGLTSQGIALYRETPDTPCDAYVMHGPGHQSRTKCEIKGPHQHHFASDPMCPGWEWETTVASLGYDGELREIPDA